MSNEQRIQLIKDKREALNQISPTFCLAKWKQTTTNLFNGTTHSCHHPKRHKIGLDEIKDNPSALHNTETKLQARLDLLNGVQTAECGFCWGIENLSQDHFSDRHYKSADEGMGIWQTFDEVVASGVGERIAPAYLEIAFESVCNLKCAYCTPDVSSRWMEEVESKGPYKLFNTTVHDVQWLKQTGTYPIHHTQPNPYIDAFWEWWPELYQSLHTFRITGGEPLLSDNTWKVIDHMIEQPRKDLTFAVNTNMCIPGKFVDRLIESVNALEGKIAKTTVFTSTESFGEQAEYCRFGMEWDKFTANCEKFLAETSRSSRLSFMTTINILSASTFVDFLDWIMELRLKYNFAREDNRVGLAVAHLRWPAYLSITNLDEDERVIFAQRVTAFIQKHRHSDTTAILYLEEIDMLERLLQYINEAKQNPTELANFVKFVDEYDVRRKTDFHKTFPNLKRVYEIGQAVIQC